ncbi:hypothetical protein [Neorhodopirellula pilleata]|uniref:Uncharacterized protein n=1 Tax=Neorhodopirellula pilleata TaxID=2714738 RepID=A0A5C5ZKU5_9BACT|nr:hypothetical protein [Neorhodopirellula pilleata]TWT87999.1 hypothetical protein Pla100_57290 [Neorhodopirellula pilleata]
MDEKTLCRSLLNVADAIPSSVTWGVVELADDRHVFLYDGRDESTSMIAEAIAGRFGEVVAVESIPSGRKDGGPLLGCLIDVGSNADDAAGRLRASYAIATTPSSDDDHGPF